MAISTKERKALFRFALLFPLLDPDLEKAERSRLAEDICSKEYDIPGSGKRTITKATLYSWLKRYQDSPNIDSLMAIARSDKGNRRKLSPETELALITLWEKNPEKPITAIVKMAEKQHLFGPEDTIQMAAIYRMFQHRARIIEPDKAKDLRRFETKFCNDAWQSDCLHGPKVLLPDGRVVTAKLFALEDDRSRFIVYGRFYEAETANCFLDCLMEAFRRRGLPHTVFVDNGSSFRDERVVLGSANLEVRLIFATVRKPTSKGKIERFFRTVRMQFFSMLPLEMLTLSELNERWFQYMEEYNRRPHSSLEHDGRPCSPLECYLSDIRAVRTPPDHLAEYFRYRDTRLVSQARTISLEKHLFQIPLGYAGKKIEVRYFTLDKVEAFYDGVSMGFIEEVDLHANANYHRRKEVKP